MRSAERSSTVQPNALRTAKDDFQPTRPELAATSPKSSSEAAAPPYDLPLECAYRWERTRGKAIFLSQPVDGKLRDWTWTQALDEARRVAAYLQAQNWPRGSHIVILSKNSAWWIMAELAIWMSGHVTVPIYASLTLESAQQLFAHCEPVACFLGGIDNPALLPQTLAPQILSIRFPNAPPCPGLAWQTLVAENDPIPGSPVRQANDLATIIYTSGTTGSPKGAMHRFAAFPYWVKAVTEVTGDRAGKRMLSYLPLAHIAERALTEMTAFTCGWRIFFCESPATFLTDLKRARPPFFFSVPRLYAKFQAGVLQRCPQPRLNRLLRIPLVSYFTRRRILKELGLGPVRAAASGSAPIAPDLLLWFRKLGLRLSEGYGTTEIGITHSAPAGKGPIGYVGRGAPGVVTKISPEGEVLVGSPMNMLGYYKDPQGTREAFADNGFIRTGDLGEINAQGWLKISGRIKEQFKTSKGKYVCPTTTEFMLNRHSAIEASLVMGSGLPAPFAVAVLSPEAQQDARTEAGCRALALPLEELLASTNSRLAPHERLKFLVLVTSKWSIEAGFLTPTLKMKRPVLEAYYAPMIPDWTKQDSILVWHIEES